MLCWICQTNFHDAFFPSALGSKPEMLWLNPIMFSPVGIVDTVSGGSGLCASLFGLKWTTMTLHKKSSQLAEIKQHQHHCLIITDHVHNDCFKSGYKMGSAKASKRPRYRPSGTLLTPAGWPEVLKVYFERCCLWIFNNARLGPKKIS